MNGLIEVYADWRDAEQAKHLGTLRTRPGRTGELFDFTFDDAALNDPTLARQALDPDLGLFSGPQFLEMDVACLGSSKIRVPIAGERPLSGVASIAINEPASFLGVHDSANQITCSASMICFDPEPYDISSAMMVRSLTIATEALHHRLFASANWRPRAEHLKRIRTAMTRQQMSGFVYSSLPVPHSVVRGRRRALPTPMAIFG